MTKRISSLFALLFILPLATRGTAATGEIVTVITHSAILQDNHIGMTPERSHRVYLPPSYASSPDCRYPVVYFLHNFYWSAPQLFADGQVQRLIERGLANGVVDEFIMVAADYTSPTTGSMYENSPVSGRWLDYTAEEIVPFIDATYRTLPTRDSRALVGDFFGGRGAIALAMHHPDLFGTVYAMHPVATGNGARTWESIGIDWATILEAKSFAELPQGREPIFVAFSQATLPHPGNPPFNCDFPVEKVNGEVRQIPERIRQVQRTMHLGEWLDRDGTADALRSLRGLAFDWGRFDPTYGHVLANRDFSRRLTDLNIPHEGEEFAGGVWDKTWTDDGRFATRVLPFLGRHLKTTAE